MENKKEIKHFKLRNEEIIQILHSNKYIGKEFKEIIQEEHLSNTEQDLQKMIDEYYENLFNEIRQSTIEIQKTTKKLEKTYDSFKEYCKQTEDHTIKSDFNNDLVYEKKKYAKLYTIKNGKIVEVGEYKKDSVKQPPIIQEEYNEYGKVIERKYWNGEKFIYLNISENNE